MKNLYLIIISCIIIIALHGCNSKDIHKNDSNSFDVQDKITDVSKITEAPITTQETGKDFQFSEEEIEYAETIAKEYYENTSFKIQSIHYDLTVSLYNEYLDEYDERNLITFSVEIIDSDNPPRNIALGRKDLESDWEVLGEGY